MPLISMAGSSVMMLPALDAMGKAIELGYRAFELFAEFPQCVPDEFGPELRVKGRAMVEDSGIALAVHAPFTSLNIAALNQGIRAESMRQTLAAIDLCAELGGVNVIVHNGEYVYKNEKGREIQWGYNTESLKTAAGRAGEKGVTLCLENIGFEPDHMDQCVDDMVRIMNEVDAPALKFCLDIGHARLNSELPRAIKIMGPNVRHIHFTDNFGKKDDHLPIGEGDFDYSPHLDFFRNFSGIITLEVINVGTDPAMALRSRDYVNILLGGQDTEKA